VRSAGVEELAGVLGHELRNPLASAVTGAALLREMLDADDPRSATVDQLLADLDRVRRLTDGWLRLARSGSADARPVEVDGLLGRVAARHGARVVSAPIEVAIAGDPALLERALENLLENARQAGATNLRLAAQRLGDAVAIHVEDDAGGIAEPDRAHIFEVGWSGRGGHGIGLHAVAVTVRAHRGHIRCVPVRHGTRFSLEFPVHVACAALA
jgi:signal transduction histidine kinase